jgi:hypothetical protein
MLLLIIAEGILSFLKRQMSSLFSRPQVLKIIDEL